MARPLGFERHVTLTYCPFWWAKSANRTAQDPCWLYKLAEGKVQDVAGDFFRLSGRAEWHRSGHDTTSGRSLVACRAEALELRQRHDSVGNVFLNADEIRQAILLVEHRGQ